MPDNRITTEEFLQLVASHRGKYRMDSYGVIRHYTDKGREECPIVYEAMPGKDNCEAFYATTAFGWPREFVHSFIDAADNSSALEMSEESDPDLVLALRHRLLTDLALWPWELL